MNDSSLKSASMYAFADTGSDLALFETANDLPRPTPSSRLIWSASSGDCRAGPAGTIAEDAHSALLLATLFRDDAHRHLEHLERAEAAAFAWVKSAISVGAAPNNPLPTLLSPLPGTMATTTLPGRDVVFHK